MRDVREQRRIGEPTDDGAAGDAARRDRVAAAVALADGGMSIDERALGIARLGHLRACRYLVHRASHSTSPRLRAAAAVSLGAFGEPADEERLTQLTDDWNAQVRSSACRGLGIGGFTEATKLLLDIASDGDEPSEVRTDALLAAARCTSGDIAGHVVEVAGRLAAASVISSSAYATVLGVVEHPSTRDDLDDLFELVMDEGGDAATARTVITSMSYKQVSPRGEALLVRALETLPGARQRVCSILVHHPVEPARPVLERLLEDPNDRVVAAALQALFALGLDASRNRLAVLLSRDGWTAHTILGALQGPEGISLAEHVTRRGPSGLRTAAFSVVAELDPARALVLAADLVNDFDPTVRLAAFDALLSGDDAARWRARAIADPVSWVANHFARPVAG